MTEFLPLSEDYEARLATMLRAIGQRSGVEPDELTGFWPMLGHKYERKLLVVGKAVNGWLDKTTRSQLAVPAQAASFAQSMRTTVSRGDCPMAWVTDLWGNPGGYSTARSAFWRFARNALIRLDPNAEDDPLWSGRLAWSNLAKVAPWSGGNPEGKLLDDPARVRASPVGRRSGDVRTRDSARDDRAMVVRAVRRRARAGSRLARRWARGLRRTGRPAVRHRAPSAGQAPGGAGRGARRGGTEAVRLDDLVGPVNEHVSSHRANRGTPDHA